MIYCRVGKCPKDNKVPLCCKYCKQIDRCGQACKTINKVCNNLK